MAGDGRIVMGRARPWPSTLFSKVGLRRSVPRGLTGTKSPGDIRCSVRPWPVVRLITSRFATCPSPGQEASVTLKIPCPWLVPNRARSPLAMPSTSDLIGAGIVLHW